ncbi:probable polyol transporter 4 isoform X2 [Cajanus cajan]|uniref:probable polyol transporter 4 isoform X2 n=1 Tax=Cajanus cajan TaxID=3821 RepID=UPI0010FB9FB5|nr:probable polyol transporter 4 isoform X2 [Cajanus cajan]
MGFQQHGNREVGLSLGTKNKYKRMNSELREGYDDVLHQEDRRNSTRKYVIACAIFASLNNVLLGYDVGVMSGAVIFIKEDLKISEVKEEFLVGILSIVSLLGSLGGGRTSDIIGRKWTMAIAAVIFQIGFSAHINWRIMLAVGILPSVFIGFALFIIPESPRWLVMQNRIQEARSVLLKTNESDREVEERLAEIQQAAGVANCENYDEKPVWYELLFPSPSLRRMMITGIGIQCFQQISGIDATVYYSPEIFKAAGIEDNAKLLAATVAVGVTKTLFILVAFFLIDKKGRRPLLFVSTIGMTLCLFSIGASLSLFSQGSFVIALAILFVCGNVAFFSVGLGPVCWVVTSEIFPLRLRAQASALGAVRNRVCSGLVAMSFLSVSRAITVAGAFFVFAAVSSLAIVFVYMFVPETKGKSLEQIEIMFKNEHERQGCEMELGDVEVEQLVKDKTVLTS